MIVFFLFYMLTFAVCSAIVILLGADMVTGISATAATLGNVGPGFNQVGPMANYADLHPISRFVLTLAMWIGRLEVITVLVILRPEAWRSAQWNASYGAYRRVAVRTVLQSTRNATIGSTRVARRAGRYAAADATSANMHRHRSKGGRIARFDAEQHRLQIARTSERADETGAMPMAASVTPRRITSPSTWPRSAPSAIRMPISCVRCTTE